MGCTLDQETINKTIAFHGHSCPGLAIGIRAAEIALERFADVQPGNLVCVTETDMCGVDAIQYLTSCTMGKGNLIHLDYGKMAFRFHDRAGGRGIRLLLNPNAWGHKEEFTRLMAENTTGELDTAGQQRLQELRTMIQQQIFSLEAEELFTIEEWQGQIPRPARVLESLVCEHCGESTMESRTRRYGGKTLCIPCFAAVEQKI